METPMIQFPNFKNIDWEDKNVFNSFTKSHSVFSDFNFISAYTWDINRSHRYSILNDNLILIINDYDTQTPHATMLGSNMVDDSLRRLHEYNKLQLGNHAIKLVPEATIRNIQNPNIFFIEEDKNNFDYVYRLKDHINYTGRRYKNKRQAANKCRRNYLIQFTTLTKIDTDTTLQLSTFMDQWASERCNSNNPSENHELDALRRVFHIFNQHDELFLTLAYFGKKLIGFSFDELTHQNTLLSHYCKTIHSYYGLTELMNQYIANTFTVNGVRYWNWEQDQGVPELSKMKLGYRPVHYQKKYIVRLREVHE